MTRLAIKVKSRFTMHINVEARSVVEVVWLFRGVFHGSTQGSIWADVSSRLLNGMWMRMRKMSSGWRIIWGENFQRYWDSKEFLDSRRRWTFGNRRSHKSWWIIRLSVLGHRWILNQRGVPNTADDSCCYPTRPAVKNPAPCPIASHYSRARKWRKNRTEPHPVRDGDHSTYLDVTGMSLIRIWHWGCWSRGCM